MISSKILYNAGMYEASCKTIRVGVVEEGSHNCCLVRVVGPTYMPGRRRTWLTGSNF